MEKMLELARQRHTLLHRHIGRLVGGEGPLAAVLPHRMPVDGEFPLPRLDIVKHSHRLGAHHRQPALAIGIEPRRKEMAAQAVRETHVHMREIAETVEKCRSLAAHFDRRGARDGKDHRQIVRRQIPKRIVLGMELAESQPVRMDIFHLAEFAGVDQLL